MYFKCLPIYKFIFMRPKRQHSYFLLSINTSDHLNTSTHTALK